MGRFNWGIEGPPDDAYSRVTEPERFKPLHEWALEAVTRLQQEYEVTLDEGQGMDSELERVPLSRPTLKVTPLQDSCAPVTIAFIDFPGLAIRFGHWATDRFPPCGCDACDEMPEEEFKKFTELLDDVVSGRFRESLYLPPEGKGSRRWELWSPRHRRSNGKWVSRDEARQILNGKEEIVLKWMPWHPKPDDVATS